MHSLRRAIACIGLTAVSSAVLAQSYPKKTVRVVVPYSAGGSADILARLTGKALSAQFGQSFVIDNRGGAGGVIARSLDQAMAQTEFTAAVASQGGELGRLTTDQFGELIKSDYVRWGKVVKSAGIKNE